MDGDPASVATGNGVCARGRGRTDARGHARTTAETRERRDTKALTAATLSQLLPPGYAPSGDQNTGFALTEDALRYATEEVFNFDVAQRYPRTLRALALLRDEDVGEATAQTIRDAFVWLRSGAFAVRLPEIYDESVARELSSADWASSVRRMASGGCERYRGDRRAALDALVVALRQRCTETERGTHEPS